MEYENLFDAFHNKEFERVDYFLDHLEEHLCYHQVFTNTMTGDRYEEIFIGDYLIVEIDQNDDEYTYTLKYIQKRHSNRDIETIILGTYTIMVTSQTRYLVD